MAQASLSIPISPVELVCESPQWDHALQNTLQTHAHTALSYLLPHHKSYTAQTFTLVLADDALIQSLNADWRDKDQPTNVLAFPALVMPDSLDTKEQTLGDVIIAFETAQQEANVLDLTLVEHSTHLMVHGLLHLLGHDHLVESERLCMEDWEIRTLETLGYTNPYE